MFIGRTIRTSLELSQRLNNSDLTGLIPYLFFNWVVLQPSNISLPLVPATFSDVLNEYSSRGYRVMAMAYRQLDNQSILAATKVQRFAPYLR